MTEVRALCHFEFQVKLLSNKQVEAKMVSDVFEIANDLHFDSFHHDAPVLRGYVQHHLS